MTTLPSSDDWSDELKAQTRDVLEGQNLFATRDGRLHLKHAGSGFGLIAADDLQCGVLRVVDIRTKREVTFASVDDLIAAGWAID